MIVLDDTRQEVVLPLFDGTGPLPARISRRFAFAYDGMTAIRVELTAGPGTRRDEVVILGVLELTGLPPRERGAPVEVRLHRSETRIEAELVDVGSGRSERLVVDAVLLE
ncbi:MAG: hypothetical protein R3F61_13440 [Myxococcota bacterium]